MAYGINKMTCLVDNLEKSKESLGEYNPKLKVYSLGEDACRIIFEYICDKYGKDNKKVKNTSNKTKFIFNNEKITKLENKGYINLN